MGGRFVSEFGMEAYPHMHTIDAFIDKPAEKYHQSLTMDFRNKARDHERRLGSYILQNFKVKQDFRVQRTHYSKLAAIEEKKANTSSHTSTSPNLPNLKPWPSRIEAGAVNGAALRTAAAAAFSYGN